MSRIIGVVTESDYLFQKIYLCLCDSATVVRLAEPDVAHALIFDTDTRLSPPPPGAITVGRGEHCALRIPFSDSELFAALAQKRSAPPLILGERCALLRGERIRLTELEQALLSRLLREKGGFVTRQQLLCDVWRGEADPGIVNVYIHYLREKLERGGERIILSSRSEGYRISDKYTREENI